MFNDVVRCASEHKLRADYLYGKHSIRLNSIELEYALEGISRDDADFMVSESFRDVANNLRTLANKIVQKIREIIMKCKAKIQEILTSLRIRKAIKEAEDACAEDETLAEKKIRIVSLDRIADFFSNLIRKIGELLSRLFSKLPIDRAKLDAVKTALIENKDKILKGCTIVVSVATAIAMFKAFVWDRYFSEEAQLIRRYQTAHWDDLPPETQNEVVALLEHICSATGMEAQIIIDELMNGLLTVTEACNLVITGGAS